MLKDFLIFVSFTVTTGSIILPAILSIGQMDPNKLPKNFDQITYWINELLINDNIKRIFTIIYA